MYKFILEVSRKNLALGKFGKELVNTVTISGASLAVVEAVAIEDHLSLMQDGDSCVLRVEGTSKVCSFIVKDSTSEHWQHNGYRFSG